MNLTTELDEITEKIKWREKALKLNIWDIGNDLLSVLKDKLYRSKYANMKAYIEDNFSFSVRQSWKFIALAKQYKDRSAVTALGVEKLYIMTTVPEEYHDEIVEVVEDNPKLTVKDLQRKIKRFKGNAGRPPSYSEEKVEHDLKFARQVKELEQDRESIRDAIKDWNESKERIIASVTSPKDRDLIEEVKTWEI